MKIACVAWGSLLWSLKGFPLAGDWRGDGPVLPLEFARHSDGDIISLVLTEHGAEVATFWAPLALDDLNAAREALREREDIRAHVREWVGSVPRPAGVDYPYAEQIERWMNRHRLDAVVWTALPPKSHDRNGRMPSADEAIDYLHGLDGADCEHAESYIRYTPERIRTPFRERIERELGWCARIPRPRD